MLIYYIFNLFFVHEVHSLVCLCIKSLIIQLQDIKSFQLSVRIHLNLIITDFHQKSGYPTLAPLNKAYTVFQELTTAGAALKHL